MKPWEMIKEFPQKYNSLVIRERVLVLLVMLFCIYFIWYFLWGFSMESRVKIAEKKREDLLNISETIMSQYADAVNQDTSKKDIAVIDKRISSVRLKMGEIDKEISQFNQETIAIGEIVLLLRDILSANDKLSLESLKVYPSEVIQRENQSTQKMDDAFEKNIISMRLKGDYSSVFDYLKKIEALQWSVFWQDVKYSVDVYPQAMVDIHLYTLSIIEDTSHVIR